jgi:TatD DNase family protein
MTYPLIDTHAHLDFDRFDADRQEVILRARDAQVACIINIAIDYESAKKSIAIAEQFPNIYATVGVHPHDVAQINEEQIVLLRELLDHSKVVAIGEVGLDFYRNISPPEVQRRYLRLFLGWARETGKPLVIHTREAEEDILSIIRDEAKSGWRGVFHCFSGDLKMAGKVLDLGFLISFTGNITFKNSRLVDVMREVPIEKMLLETDSPFLSPVPHRGKRNEPAYVHYVAQKIAEVKGLSMVEVARITTENAQELFGFRLMDVEQ